MQGCGPRRGAWCFWIRELFTNSDVAWRICRANGQSHLYSADHHIFTYPQPTKELREGTNLGRFKVSAVIVSDAVSFVSAAKESMEAVLFSKVRRLAIHVVSWSDMGFNQKKIRINYQLKRLVMDFLILEKVQLHSFFPWNRSECWVDMERISQSQEKTAWIVSLRYSRHLHREVLQEATPVSSLSKGQRLKLRQPRMIFRLKHF